MKHFFSILLLVFCSPIFAQYSMLNDYITRNWSTADGMPGNSAVDIIQTSDGYIYVGTYEGLAKFNGLDFTLINKQTNSNHTFHSARSIFEDSQGNLWIGSNDEGVEKISSDGNISFSTTNGLPNNSIRAFAEDLLGNIWIGTAAGFCYITKNNEIVIPEDTQKYNLTKNMITSLFSDSSGRLWIMTSDESGLYYYSGDKLYRYNDLDLLGNFYVTSMSQDSFGVLWLGLGIDGIACINQGEIKRLQTNTILDSSSTWTICHDSNGSTWFGTTNGIVVYRNGIFEQFNVDSENYFKNSINKIIEDREHNIWIATDTSGIIKMNPGKFRTQHLNTAINAITEDATGLMWLGSDDGLYCFDKDVSISNELTDFCKGFRIRHVATTKNGDILVNAYTKPSQIRYSKDGIKNWTTDDGLAGDKTRVSIESRNGDIYVGTTTGLSIIKPNGEIKNFTRGNGLDTEYIMCIYEDTEGNIWIGTDGGGIYIMKDEKIIEKITTKNGLIGNVIFKIMQDSQNIFWICTGTGISRYEKQNKEFSFDSTNNPFFNYTLSMGLGTNSVFQMIIDHSNNVWMTSNKGISSIPLSDLNKLANGEIKKIDAKFYNQNDGIKTTGVNSTSLSTIDKYNRIWFTLVDGYTIYDPMKNKSSGILPLVHIESVTVDGKKVDNERKSITLPAGTKRLKIDFSGLSFVSPERIRFKYMLEGFDEDFSEPTQQRQVSYTNLKPGTYNFKVIAMNADEMWNKSPEELLIEQQPFYYQRPLFWEVICVAIITFIIIFILLREQKNKQIQLQLEKMVQIQTVDLQMERDKSERLLKSILPESIAAKLKDPSQKIIAEKFDKVTILFSDIQDFTKISEQESPEDIVNALNDLFSKFDITAKEMGVEKIKTIGDAYMAACGVPTENKNHANIMLAFAKKIYKNLEEYNKTAKIKFQIRVGMNSGPVVAGVIGKDKFIYDIWGDAVNTASRMESLCTPGKIRITESVKALLDNQNELNFSLEENCKVKGKGTMHAYEL